MSRVSTQGLLLTINSPALNTLMKNLNTRTVYLAELKSFGVSCDIMSLFHNAVIASVKTYEIVCRDWNGSKREQRRADRVI